jgi:hypothetical protein
MPISFCPDDLVLIQGWPNVPSAWYDRPKQMLHVKVAIGNSDRTLTFDLAAHADHPGNLRHWVAFEVMRTAGELRDVENVRRRLTA